MIVFLKGPESSKKRRDNNKINERNGIIFNESLIMKDKIYLQKSYMKICLKSADKYTYVLSINNKLTA